MTSLKEMIIVGNALLDSGAFHPVLVIVFKNTFRNINRYNSCNLEVLDLCENENIIQYQMNVDQSLLNKNKTKIFVKNAIRNVPGFNIIRFVYRRILYTRKRLKEELGFFTELILKLKKLKYYERKTVKIFKSEKPKGILFAGDRNGGFEAAFIKIAGKNNCFSLTVPFGHSRVETLTLFRKDMLKRHVEANPQKIFKKLINILLKKQVRNSKFGPILFDEPAETISLYFMKMLPNNPWYTGGGHTSMVGVLGKDEYNYLINNGVPKSKIIITGQPNHDLAYRLNMAANEDNYFKKNYSLIKGRKNIVCALPHLGEQGFLDWDSHWNEMEFLSERLASIKENILISLHPKAIKSQYLYLEKKFNIKIIDEYLQQVLSLANIFVSTYSNTVNLAIMLNIPTVVIDFYGLDFNYFNEFKGVLIIKNKNQLSQVLNKITKDEEYFRYLIDQQKVAAEGIGKFDGKSCERIIKVLKEKIPDNMKINDNKYPLV